MQEFLTETIHKLFITDVEMLLLAWKIGKENKFHNFLFTRSTKFPPFFQNWEPGGQTKLAQAYYVFSL